MPNTVPGAQQHGSRPNITPAGAHVLAGARILEDSDLGARALGVLGAVDTLGWVWGPLYGAMIIRFLAWRWQFYFNVPLAILGIIAAWYVLSDSTEEQKQAYLPPIAYGESIFGAIDQVRLHALFFCQFPQAI